MAIGDTTILAPVGKPQVSVGRIREDSMQDVAAMVLAGGRNEGFGVLTMNRAKSALPYAGHYRLVDFPLSSLADSGVQRVGLIIQYLPSSLLDHVGTGKAWDYDGVHRRLKIMPPFVGVGDTEWFLGSADALRRNLGFVRPDKERDVIICSGEHVCSIDYSEIIDFHRERNADVTIVARRVSPDVDSKRFGRLEFDPETGKVRRFVEKPDEPFSDWISTGVYVFRREVLEQALMEGDPPPNNLPRDVVEPVSKQGRTFAYVFDGVWEYLEDLGAYYRRHQVLLRGEDAAPVWDVRTNMLDRGLGSRSPAFIGPSGEVVDSIVSLGCEIHGQVINSVLAPGVYVGPDAEVRDSILLHDSRVEPGASIARCIGDKDIVFGGGCRIGIERISAQDNPMLPASAQDLAVIGKAARIGAGVELPVGVQVFPGAPIEAGDPELVAGELNLGASKRSEVASW